MLETYAFKDASKNGLNKRYTDSQMDIQDQLDRIDILKTDLRKARKELESALEKTDIFTSVFNQTKKCEVEISDKDARKHALSVALKYFSS